MVPVHPNMTKVGESIETTRQSVARMFQILERAALLIMLYSGKSNMQQLAKPEKVYLENTNLMYALSAASDIGNVRETFFANQLKFTPRNSLLGTRRFSDRRYLSHLKWEAKQRPLNK